MSLKEAFVEQIQQNQGLINKIVFFYADNSEDQNDLRQEILYQAWKSYKKFRGDAKFSTWLYQVGLNVAVSRFRKKKIQIADVGEPPERGTPTQSSGKELLQQIMNVLSPVEKSIVLLQIEGYKQPEIADMLGITENNTRVKIHRIRQKLTRYGIHEFVE